MQWTEGHAPKALDEVAGNPSAIAEVRKWAETWKKGTPALLLVGAPGVGKTATALALAKTMGWDLLEMNSSDQRSKDAINRSAGLASVSATFSGNRRMILFDEADGLFRDDRGGTTAMLEIVKAGAAPVVLTANDAYAKQLSSIRQCCTKVEFKKVHYATITKVLRDIALSHGVKASDAALDALARNAQGDLKAAINDLQALSEGRSELDEKELLLTDRDRSDNIFNAMRSLFKATDFKKARSSIELVEENPEMFCNWVDENIPREYEDAGDVARAYEALSKADVYAGRVMRRQSWSLLKFSMDLMTAGVALAKREPYHKFTPYSFPQFISALSRSKARRALRKAVAEKVGTRLHASTREVIQEYLPFLEKLFEHEEKAVAMSAHFGFTDEDLEYFGFTEAKAKKLLEKSAELQKTLLAERRVDGKQKGLSHFS
jgi:replication factor C large subunit